jgi:hypothetical protein
VQEQELWYRKVRKKYGMNHLEKSVNGGGKRHIKGETQKVGSTRRKYKAFRKTRGRYLTMHHNFTVV